MPPLVEVVEPPLVDEVEPPLEDVLVLEPPEDVLVVEPPEEVLVLEPPEVELEPPDEELVLELFDDLLDLLDLLDFEKLPLFVDLQKIKQLLLLLLPLLQKACASVGAVATTLVVASETPTTAALVSLMYCIIAPSLTDSGSLT